jgi:hypothetical protein
MELILITAIRKSNPKIFICFQGLYFLKSNYTWYKLVQITITVESEIVFIAILVNRVNRNVTWSSYSVSAWLRWRWVSQFWTGLPIELDLYVNDGDRELLSSWAIWCVPRFELHCSERLLIALLGRLMSCSQSYEQYQLNWYNFFPIAPTNVPFWLISLH